MRLRLHTLLAVLLLGTLVVAPARAGTGMFVGAAEDQSRKLDPLTAKTNIDLAAVAGLGTIRLTTNWPPGATVARRRADDAAERRRRRRSSTASALILSIYQSDQRTTPLTVARARRVRAVRGVDRAQRPADQDFIIGNEPNLNLFWMPQFGAERRRPRGAVVRAAARADLRRAEGCLARHQCDRRRLLAARQRQGEARTSDALTDGVHQRPRPAYRTAGRTTPIMDMFALPSVPDPFAAASDLRASEHDDDRDRRLPEARRAADAGIRGDGAAGRDAADRLRRVRLPDDDPGRKRSLYVHFSSPAARDAITESRQALYYQQAIALARCQPTVAGMLIFHVTDERDANAWQSGVYYADDTPKTSMDAIRASALAAQDATAGACTSAKTVNNFVNVVFHQPPVDPGPLQIDLTCASRCAYRARLIDLHDGQTVQAVDGEGEGKQTIAIPSDGRPTGSYQYTVRTFVPGKPATAVVRSSEPFTITAPPPPPPPTDESAPADPPAEPLPPPEALLPLLPLVPSLPTLAPVVP